MKENMQFKQENIMYYKKKDKKNKQFERVLQNEKNRAIYLKKNENKLMYKSKIRAILNRISTSLVSASRNSSINRKIRTPTALEPRWKIRPRAIHRSPHLGRYSSK